MSMGYDPDDPRKASMLRKLDAGVFKLQPGEKPVTRRKGMPNRFASVLGGGRSR